MADTGGDHETVDANGSPFSRLASRVAESLIGTCNSFERVLRAEFDHFEDLPLEFYAEFDLLAAKCETCDWWVEPHELDSYGSCEGCQGVDDDDQA
jgi:hypothetical protein